jgi:hypothetical protein
MNRLGAIMFDTNDRLMSAMYQHISYNDFSINIDRVEQITYAAEHGQEIKMNSIEDLEKVVQIFKKCEGYDFLKELRDENLSYVAEKLTMIFNGPVH